MHLRCLQLLCYNLLCAIASLLVCCRQWRQEQEERLAKKDAAEQEAIEEQRQLAQRELEEVYRRMDEQLEQTKARNRSVCV